MKLENLSHDDIKIFSYFIYFQFFFQVSLNVRYFEIHRISSERFPSICYKKRYKLIDCKVAHFMHSSSVLDICIHDYCLIHEYIHALVIM